MCDVSNYTVKEFFSTMVSENYIRVLMFNLNICSTSATMPLIDTVIIFKFSIQYYKQLFEQNQFH